MATIIGTLYAFTTDHGTYDLDKVLAELRRCKDALPYAAADIIEMMLPDHRAAQAKRDRIAELQAEIDAIRGEDDGE
jgi:hypothetical protein